MKSTDNGELSVLCLFLIDVSDNRAVGSGT